ncbi:MAG: ABC transporter ATP-binding protein [Rhodobacter sp.]|nr:ABC transporter ATP-binding protein [Rhodobacter sp.]
MSGIGNSGSLRLKSLVKRYGSFTAVEDVNLEIERGEFLTLLGPSGSGKTTLLMMMAGFQDITSGDILLDGQSIAAMPAERRNFGMVFQGYALFPHMTVRDNIAYPLSVRKRPKSEITAKVDEMLDLVHLTDFGHRFPKELSGGQQQRVALARALCFAPPVLLLDEPLGALDKKLRVEVQAQLKEIHNRVGTTFVFVTHDQEEALSMSDRIVIMNHGRIEQVGTPSELYQHPRTVFAASFLGKSNFLHRNDAVYALRPEKIDLAAAGAGQGANTVSGIVQSVTYFGAMLKYQVQVPELGEIEVDVDAWRGGTPLAEGTAVDLTWADAAAVLLLESAPK